MQGRARSPQLSRANADRHELYTLAVQSPDAEIDFVTRTFRKLRGRPLRRLREDFCGTGATACEFVSRHADNHAVGLDLDTRTLAWGREHRVGKLAGDARDRVNLLRSDVRTPPRGARNVDAVLAMNFSYWILSDRGSLLGYFKTVRDSLAPDGLFFLDTYGGYEASKEMQERRRVSAGRGRWFKYVWDQAWFDPLSNHMKCHIHFEFERGPAWNKAFTYRWRLWSIPETRELLLEAGFKRVTIYWEGDDNKGGGNGVFTPRKVGEQCASFIAYIVAER